MLGVAGDVVQAARQANRSTDLDGSANARALARPDTLLAETAISARNVTACAEARSAADRHGRGIITHLARALRRRVAGA